MKKNGKYFLRFAGVCAALGLVLVMVGAAVGGETQLDFNWGDSKFYLHPWGVTYNSDYDYDADYLINDFFDSDDDDYSKNSDVKKGFVIDEKLDAFSTIDASMVSEDVLIEYGTDYNIAIRDDSDNVKYSLENGKLKVWRKKDVNFSILSVKNQSGAVVITVPKGAIIEDCTVITVSGDAYIKINADTCSGGATSGDFEFAGNYKTLDMNSVSGEISSTGAADKIDANTISGDIEIKGAILGVQAETVSGETSVEINGSRADYTVQASTVSGDIEIDKDNFRKSATAGNGANKIKVNSVSGDIDVEFLR